MERTKQKSKKDKPNKYVEKEKSSTFIADVKTLKENLKIREILRTVKMNSSMRMKAPRGSKVMQNKDFNDNEDIFEGKISVEGQEEEPTSATNTVLNTEIEKSVQENRDDYTEERKEVSECECTNHNIDTNLDVIESELSEKDKTESSNTDTSVVCKSKSLSECLESCGQDEVSTPKILVLPSPVESPKTRDRKLSLDHTMLLRSEGLSQSEVDLHSIGKSPLERKSSFFRKKMDSFVRNTTEIFKRQSLSGKSTRSPLIKRRDSNSSRISVSLQSLNENPAYYEEYGDIPIEKYHDKQGSATSLRSGTTPVRSDSTVSVNASDRQPDQSEESLAGSLGLGSRPFAVTNSASIHSLNEGHAQDSLLNTRAISMSSGLDTANGQRRRKTSRTNRVSWLASESLTDYFRRLIQDEKSQQIQGCHSFQDFSAIPENHLVVPRTDSKGRRLSYVRAVSGEDPALSARYQDSSFRRRKIPENEPKTPQPDIEFFLSGFEKTCIPDLEGFTPYKIVKDAEYLLDLLDTEAAVEQYFNWKSGLPAAEEVRQEIIKELIYTEAAYIRHLRVIVKVYIAAAHELQNRGVLQGLNTATLFPHIPDIYNANVKFWERSIYPMAREAKAKETLFDPKLMIPGFMEFAEIFDCYEDYVQCQTTAVEYLREMHTDPEFLVYLAWCNQHTGNRLQLADILVKPMQRLTKYSLLVSRLSSHVDDEGRKRDLENVDSKIRSFTLGVNRAVRQREECLKIEDLKIEPYEPDFRDDVSEKAYKKFNTVNLLLPMIDCGPVTNRCLIHQGILRYKDYLKEFDSQILLFTDMILVCKKYPKVKEKDKDKEKKEYLYWKMLRPRILLHRAVPNIKPGRSAYDPPTLIYVVLDEQGCSKAVFQLSETSKDQNPVQTLKIWESKFYEAMMTYTLTKWYFKYPVKDLSIIEREYNDDFYRKENPEVCAVEKKARERVAATMHAQRQQDVKDPDVLLSVIDRERGPPHLHSIFESGIRNYNACQSRSSSIHQSTTSRSSRHRSSSDLRYSMSGGSHEELRSVSLQRSASSVDQNLPACFYDDSMQTSPSITVNIAPENDSQTLIPSPRGPSKPQPPTLVLQQSSPHHTPGPRSASAGCENTLHVAPLPSHSMYSMPDIKAELNRAPELKFAPQSASEKLYKSHQELMQRNRLAAGQHYLSPDHRGSSYPPPSPTRALKRGMAFSDSFKYNPPLTRSQKVHSISQAQIEAPKLSEPSHRFLERRVFQRTERVYSRAYRRSPSSHSFLKLGDVLIPCTSNEKQQKKSSFLKRSKDSTRSGSPKRSRASSSDDSDYDADDDRSRQSTKGDKTGENQDQTEQERTGQAEGKSKGKY